MQEITKLTYRAFSETNPWVFRTFKDAKNKGKHDAGPEKEFVDKSKST